jgi:hypothetical protein
MVIPSALCGRLPCIMDKFSMAIGTPKVIVPALLQAGPFEGEIVVWDELPDTIGLRLDCASVVCFNFVIKC